MHTGFMASVSSVGSSVAGEQLTLTCSVSVLEGASGIPIVEWRGADGSILTNMESGRIVVGDPTTNGSTTTVTLQFSPLHTSNAGVYTCQGALSFTEPERTDTVTLAETIVVNGELSFSREG